MPELSPEGRRAVDEIAGRTGFSPDAVSAMLLSIAAGRGAMAQFDHPEFGGSGQWMSGGAIMISDMFNNALKARVDALCRNLSALVRNDPAITAPASFQSQSQGAPEGGGGPSGLFAVEAGHGADWWPSGLGTPSSVGAQNDVRYAYFPAARRLAVDRGGKVTLYDTEDHRIAGFSQQQAGSGSLGFASQQGAVDLGGLRVVSGEAVSAGTPERKPPPAESAPSARSGAGGHAEILTTIERLAELRERGVLTEAEFSAKKAQLLDRL